MLTKRRSLSMAVTGVLLFLSVAVFGLGLHNKLCLYRASRHCHHRITKLSVRQRSAKLLLGREQEKKSASHIPSPKFFWALLFSQGNGLRFSHSRFVQLKLCTPCRCDLLGPNRLALPPPTLS